MNLRRRNEKWAKEKMAYRWEFSNTNERPQATDRSSNINLKKIEKEKEKKTSKAYLIKAKNRKTSKASKEWGVGRYTEQQITFKD